MMLLQEEAFHLFPSLWSPHVLLINRGGDISGNETPHAPHRTTCLMSLLFHHTQQYWLIIMLLLCYKCFFFLLEALLGQYEICFTWHSCERRAVS